MVRCENLEAVPALGTGVVVKIHDSLDQALAGPEAEIITILYVDCEAPFSYWPVKLVGVVVDTWTYMRTLAPQK